MLHTIRRLARSLLVMGMLAGTSAGCVDLFGATRTCSAEVQPGLVIVVVDAATGASVPATITVIDGAYIETLAPSDAFHGEYIAAEERAGVYQIEVSSDGYATVRLQDIEVTEDACHVIPERLEVRLERAAR
jgi:hypothetical protein